MTIAILTVIALLLGCYFYTGYKNTHAVAMNHIKIDNDAVPAALSSSLRILHLSDLHLENISITPEKLYHVLKDQPIDLIALTGDFLDRKRTIPKLVPYLEVLQKLQPVYGTYAVFGNHDYVLREDNFKKLKDLLQAYGVKVMQNEHESMEVDGQILNIIGIDDFSTQRSNIEKSYDGLRDGCNLVLTHDPNIVLSMKNHHYDYLLSGHFHGGQIHWPKPYHLVKMGKLARMNMVKGLHHHHGQPLYISEGLGQTGLNIRIGSRPEITFHKLRFYVEAKDNKTEQTIAG